jgi:phage terminase large subunit-like protein
MDPRLEDFNPLLTASDHEAVRQGYVWCPERATRVIEFIETFCRLYVGRWAGQPIKLMPYQVSFLAMLEGWHHPETGQRRFREAYLEAAKKQGKSPLISGLALYGLFASGERAPEVYINATSREQATIVYRNAVKMLEQEEEFDGLYRLIDRQKRILTPFNDGILVANSADSPSKAGLQASMTIFDELCQQPNRDLWAAFEYAGRSRENPLLISITNAGEPDPDHPCYQQHKRALAVEDGSLIDVRFLGAVYGPREENPDINDRAVWKAANPALGYIVKEEDIAEDLRKAKEAGPAALANFKRYVLSIWERQERKWLDMGVWLDQPAPRSDEEIEESGDVWAAGLDLSSLHDTTAYVRVSGHPAKGVDVFAHFFVPRETAVRRQREEHLPYLEWAEQGYVTLCDGPVIDHKEVLQYIIDDAARLNGRLKRVYSDEWNSHEIRDGLRKAGIDHQFCTHGHKTFHPPMRVCESMLARRVLRHGNNPVLNNHAGNAQVDDNNPNQNKRIVKPKDKARVDGMVGLVQGVLGIMDLVGYDGEGQAEDVITDGRIIWRPYGGGNKRGSERRWH